MVGGFHDIQIVFDHHDRIALIDQFMKHFQQLSHILEMQTRRRLVQDIERAPRAPLRQLFRQLHPLRLAARQGRRLLAHLDIAQTHTHQRVHLLADRGHRLEEFLRILDRHIQNVGNAFALEVDLQSFAVVTFAPAGLAFDIDVGQEVHLDLDDAIALTGLAAPALDVEAEPAGLVPARFRFRQTGEPVTDRRECPDIGRRI